MSPKSLSEIKNIPEFRKSLKSKNEDFWIERGEKMALELFHEMAERVPAYKDFLKNNKVDHSKIKTVSDFKKVPLVDKDNYLRKYSREDLCWDGKFSSDSWVISTTSGSTGKPFYFPRTPVQDEYYAITAELYLLENFQIDKKSTLYINAFAMGAWIGGLFTYEAVHSVAKKGYPLSIISPGVNKQEVINSVLNLGKDFDQVIIGCYPPMLKDIIDLGNDQGIAWSDYNLGIVFSAEGFTEKFRDYVIKNASLSNEYTSSLNHYGSVDLGTMSHETPASIMIRRDSLKNKKLQDKLFSTNRQPTLTQFVPEMFYFEMVKDSIVCSSYSGIPLVRYDLKDSGGVLTLSEVEKAYKDHDLDFNTELTNNKLDSTKWNLPFVYIFERSDFSVSFVGANIYPQEIQKALFNKELSKYITGRFTMEITYDRKMFSKLVVHCELKNKVEINKSIAKEIQKSVVDTLLEENSEYANNHSVYKRKIWPTIKLYKYEDQKYFSGQGKQKWSKK